MDWSLISQTPNEIIVIDRAAEKSALDSLGRDAETFGYTLSNVRVSRLGEMMIVRMDVYDPKRKEKVGIAIKTITRDNIDEGMKIF